MRAYWAAGAFIAGAALAVGGTYLATHHRHHATGGPRTHTISGTVTVSQEGSDCPFPTHNVTVFDGSGAAIAHTTLSGDHGHPGSTLTTLPVSYSFRFTDVPDEEYYKIKDDLGLSWAFLPVRNAA